MASPEEIRAIRDYQKQAADSGAIVSYRQAQKALAAQEESPQQKLNALRDEISVTKGELKALKAEFGRLRIAGLGFSGQGSKIQFTADSFIDAARLLVVKDEGTIVATGCQSLNFVGSTISATNAGGSVTVTVTPYALTIKDEGASQTTACTTINFVGTGVTATAASGVATVTIPAYSPPYSTPITSIHTVLDGTTITTEVLTFLATSSGPYTP